MNRDEKNKGKVVVITGAAGVLCGVIAEDFAARGARVALLDIDEAALAKIEKRLSGKGFTVKGYAASVLDKAALEEVRRRVENDLGICDILVNGAGGNNPAATTGEEFFDAKNNGEVKSFFDLTEAGVDFVFNLNFKGAFLTTQIFARSMAARGGGNILNISSMNAYTPLTKIPAYSAAKAAVSNFTEWLAVYFAGAGVRVNAIAPGFFATNQNKALLYNADGGLTERSAKILRNTPMNRFGKPEELLGAVRFLTDDASSGFVTGVVLPIDGGFKAYSGV
ncbi:MAG: SDR family oxidoreductase [Clostridiaceae bacterium]|jgi:NAD(P)-dependent dehydrogenase (short-subunit alcohol dehydrogenase family)|nr:SDR family oxidoreductase [Clostridiaceae bacterium]